MSSNEECSKNPVRKKRGKKREAKRDRERKRENAWCVINLAGVKGNEKELVWKDGVIPLHK